MNRQARRAHQAGWSGVATGVASLAVIMGLTVAGMTAVATTAVTAQAASSSSGVSPSGGISVPVD
jgi:hypothetical protein